MKNIPRSFLALYLVWLLTAAQFSIVLSLPVSSPWATTMGLLTALLIPLLSCWSDSDLSSS